MMNEFKEIDRRLAELLKRIEDNARPMTKDFVALNVIRSKGFSKPKRVGYVGTWAYTDKGVVVNWAMGALFPSINSYKCSDYPVYVRMYNKTNDLREEDFESFKELNDMMQKMGY